MRICLEKENNLHTAGIQLQNPKWDFTGQSVLLAGLDMAHQEGGSQLHSPHIKANNSNTCRN